MRFLIVSACEIFEHACQHRRQSVITQTFDTNWVEIKMNKMGIITNQ